jgi:hypothetical protein
MKPIHAASNELIELTHKVWQPRLKRKLSDEDGRQLAENVTGFFAILAEWARASSPDPQTAPVLICQTQASHDDR